MDKIGISPAVAYKKVGLDRAKRLLVQTRAPMIDIAIETGLRTPRISRGYFARHMA